MEITAPLKTTINKLLGDKLTIEYYSHEPDLLQSYQHRITSLFNAFDFLCEANPPSEKKRAEIKPYLDWCHQHCHFEKTWTATQYQKQLTHYTTFLVDAIANLWDLAPKESIALLDKAEQYFLLQTPRPTIATLSKTDSGSPNFVLTVDNPLAPFTKETIEELKRIKSPSRARSRLSNQNQSSSLFLLDFPDTKYFNEIDATVEPADWFFHLPDVEKTLLYHTLQKIDLDDPKAVFCLSSRLRTIPGLANFAANQTSIINTVTGEITKTFEPRLRSSHLGSRDTMKYPREIYELHTRRNVDRLLEYVNQDDQSKPHPLLIQTLISPILLHNPDYWLEQQRQCAVICAKNMQNSIYSTNHPFNYARVAISTQNTSPECLEILHAAQDHLNEMRRHDDPTQEQPLQTLNELISEYDKTLNSGRGTAWITDYNGRELFLSSLEDLLVSFIGGVSYGSCVSGKDRKAIQLIHTNAMLLFHFQYGYWPKYTDLELSQDRKNFVRIFTALYCSQHYQLFSGHNAPGSDGIKNPGAYLTRDICDSIKSNHLTQDDQLASNNEVENIVPVANVLVDFPSRIMEAIRLTPSQTQCLITLLAIIVQEKKFWASLTTPNPLAVAASYLPSFFQEASTFIGEPNFTPSDAAANQIMPDTVTEIFNILARQSENPESSTGLTQKLADIYDAILHRDSSNHFRHTITKLFYNTLENFRNAPNDPKAADALFKTNIEVLRQIKVWAFDFKKEHRSTALTISPQAI
ncbi:MAG: hypothetical protein A3F46_06070 [Legionellales bacterium RIFCSPHIGHO2_12_FULL_42_9]|nr:MAG: hypothetical protein A3F46_06070 [Legionellales bacterium RIFCSPHIGHO2_12_FULL_42_9]